MPLLRALPKRTNERSILNPPVLVIHIEVDQKQSDLPTTFWIVFLFLHVKRLESIFHGSITYLQKSSNPLCNDFFKVTLPIAQFGEASCEKEHLKPRRMNLRSLGVVWIGEVNGKLDRPLHSWVWTQWQQRRTGIGLVPQALCPASFQLQKNIP